jgi:hypothetical protein
MKFNSKYIKDEKEIKKFESLTKLIEKLIKNEGKFEIIYPMPYARLSEDIVNCIFDIEPIELVAWGYYPNLDGTLYIKINSAIWKSTREESYERMSRHDVHRVERTIVDEMEDLIEKIKRYTNISVDIDVIYGEW